MEENKPQEVEQEQPSDPRSFVKKFPGAPTDAQLDEWKAVSCSGRIKIFSDSLGKRAFIMRGLSGREFEAVEMEVPANLAADKFQSALMIASVVKACLWTSVTSTKRLDPEVLRNSGAGLASALYEVVSELSDFMSPQVIQQLSGDL